MNLKNPKEWEKYRDSIRQFVKNELDPLAEEVEKTGKLPKDILTRLASQKLMGLTTPKEYGGEELTFSEYWPILEEIAKSHGSFRLLVHGANGFWRMLHGFGTKEQRHKHIPPVIRGERVLGFALTEPGTGTGVDIKSTAVRDGDNYLINGKKHLISFSDFADPFHIFAYTDKSLGKRGVTGFILDRVTPGFKMVDMPETMGLRGSGHAELTFENAVVPVSNLVGKEGQGLDIAFSFLEISRLAIAVSCLGLAQRFVELSVDYAKERVTFGKALAERQAIQGMLAEMATEVYAARQMITDAAIKWDDHKPIPAESSMCKLFALEALARVSDSGLRIFGGIGYFRTYPIERMYRDARALWFEEGTPTIQKMVIARNLLK